MRPTSLLRNSLSSCKEVRQSNESEQDGDAVATATSDFVSVEQSGALSAGGNGITATSSAVAVAGLEPNDIEQTANQHNSNTQEVVRAAPAEGETTVQPFTRPASNSASINRMRASKMVTWPRSRPLTRWM